MDTSSAFVGVSTSNEEVVQAIQVCVQEQLEHNIFPSVIFLNDIAVEQLFGKSAENIKVPYLGKYAGTVMVYRPSEDNVTVVGEQDKKKKKKL